MKHFRLVMLVLLFTSIGMASIGMAGQTSPVPLSNGQKVTLRGVLTMQPAGRLQFVTVKTAAGYAPTVVGDDRKQHAAETVHEVGLSGYNRYDLLYRHRGQTVTVTGTMMTDGASPYYFHSTLLKVSSIRLQDGTDLIGMPRAVTGIAVDTGNYRATVLLPADPAAPWQYSAHGSPDPDRSFLSCSSNGGGDVVNCYCAQGFRALQVDSARGNVHEKGAVVLKDMAQVGVGEDAHPSAVSITVTCSR